MATSCPFGCPAGRVPPPRALPAPHLQQIPVAAGLEPAPACPGLPAGEAGGALTRRAGKKKLKKSQEQCGQNLHIQQRLDLGYQQTDPRVQGPLSPPDLLSDRASPWKIQFPLLTQHFLLRRGVGVAARGAAARAEPRRCGSQMMLPAPAARSGPGRGRASPIPHTSPSRAVPPCRRSPVTGGGVGGFNPNRASLDPSDSKGREINVILGVLGRSHLPGGSSRAGKHRSQREIGSYPPDCLSKWDTVYILFTFLQGRCSERVINHLCSCWATSCCRPSKIHTTKPALITAPSALHSSQLLMHSHLLSLSVSLLLSSICCFLPFAISRGTRGQHQRCSCPQLQPG